MEYKSLVLELLVKRKYPVLQDFVVLDIHYKIIPDNAPCDVIHSYDQRIHDPSHVWKQHMDPYRLSYLVNNYPLFYVHELDHLDASTLPLECLRVKLSRCFVDALRNQISQTFEEELYHFLTLLNFDAPRLSPLLGVDFMTCTRMLPQFIRLWAYNYEEKPMEPTPVGTQLSKCFGPPDDLSILPVRVLRGRVAPCSSQSTILSLNNDHEAHLTGHCPYIWHYSVRHRTLFPLAYNPLENPIIV